MSVTQILSLESELQLLKELSNLDDDKKSSLIFESLEKDSTGKFCSQKLFDGMRTIHGNDCFIADVNLAMDKAQESAPVSLDESEFTNLLRSICSMMGCSMDELTKIIVTNVLFTESLDASLHKSPYLTEAYADEAKAHDYDADVDKNHELRRAVKDTRMMALFKVFDRSGEGTVDFKEIVVGLYKIMDDIDEASHAAVSALLLFDENNRRKLTYDEFARLMLNITASAPEHITFDDVADHLTRNATDVSSGVTDEYVLEKFSMAKAAKLLNNLTEDEKFVSLGLVELVKMDRLFAMFDTGHDGAVDAKELAVGLRYETHLTKLPCILSRFSNAYFGAVNFINRSKSKPQWKSPSM